MRQLDDDRLGSDAAALRSRRNWVDCHIDVLRLLVDGQGFPRQETKRGWQCDTCDARNMAHTQPKLNVSRANHRSEVERNALRHHACLFGIERDMMDA